MITRTILVLSAVLAAAGPAQGAAPQWSEYRPVLVLAAPNDINSQAYESSLRAAGLMVSVVGTQQIAAAVEAPRFLVAPEKAAAGLDAAQVNAVLAHVRRGATLVTDGESP